MSEQITTSPEQKKVEELLSRIQIKSGNFQTISGQIAARVRTVSLQGDTSAYNKIFNLYVNYLHTTNALLSHWNDLKQCQSGGVDVDIPVTIAAVERKMADFEQMQISVSNFLLSSDSK